MDSNKSQSSQVLQRSQSRTTPLLPTPNTARASTPLSKSTTKPRTAAGNKINKPKENRESNGGSGSRSLPRRRDTVAAVESLAHVNICSKLRAVRYAGGAGSGGGGSPSAWALSPGRNDQSPKMATGSMDFGGGGKWRSGSVGSNVLGIFRQKKASSVKKEAVHELRMLVSRYLQWRFVNARAQAAIDATKLNAEKKLFSAWARLREVRKLVAAKKTLMQRVKHQMKLHRMLIPQIHLLTKWEMTSEKTMAAVIESSAILQELCTYLPLVEGAQVDIEDLHDAMCTVMDIMVEMETMFDGFYDTMEKSSVLLDELVETLQLEMKGLEGLMRMVATVSLLQINEISLRAGLVQLAKNSTTVGFPVMTWRHEMMPY